MTITCKATGRVRAEPCPLRMCREYQTCLERGKMTTNDLTLEAPWVGREPEDVQYPACPVCGAEEPEVFFFSRDGVCFGCNECVRQKDYYELEGDI